MTIEPAAPSPDPSPPSAIPEEERQDTLREIEELIRAGHRPIRDGKGQHPGTSGAVLPAIVIAASLVLMGAGFLILPGLYDRDEARMVLPAEAGPGGGAELFRALREEAGQQIEEREKAIGELRVQYDRARSERETLRREFDARLADRARELEAGIAAELEAERRRLAAEGLTEAAVAARLKEFQDRQERERKAELDAFQARLAAEAAERDRQLAAAAARYNEELQRSTDPLKAEITRLTAERRGSEEARIQLERRYDEALAEAARARKDYEDRIAALERRLRDAEAQTARLSAAETRRTAARDRVDALLRTARGEPARTASRSGDQELLLDLLKAKAEVRALLAEEPAKSARPGLAERLDRYFETFEGEYRSQGRKQAFSEAAEAAESAAAGRPARGLPAGDADLVRFLEKLRDLLR
ncbi:MAG TPA: hypothetical protein P5117_04855 [Spirochaetia bacterium]|nr:hypothetical protein [Spirochaetales bacterium]HRY80510.1 hypothetical protein [Spirochaetia bacterium]HRZ88797.1 hypothetical protein [Spirochaetia bacterium]